MTLLSSRPQGSRASRTEVDGGSHENRLDAAASGDASEPNLVATPVDVHKLPLGDDMYTTNAPKREPSDPAYEYDRNPNSISEYGLQGALSANPKRNSKPSWWEARSA